MLARLAYAILAGIIAAIITLVIGTATGKYFDASLGEHIKNLAGLVGLLIAVIYFFVFPKSTWYRG